MVRDAVAHGFNEDGFAAPGKRHAACLEGDFTHGEDVVPIDAHGVDAVSDTAAGDAVATVLF